MRFLQLDVLRAIAVLLVMVRHLEQGENPGLRRLVDELRSCPVDLAHAPHLALMAVFRCGWMGVDLFFVLSGFLVSGLLFRDHDKLGRVRLKRFLIRRGFKIVPPFYVFLFGTVVALTFFSHRPLAPKALLAEAVFVQNYGPNIWGHTWSLAVEEHFYLLLGLLLFVLVRRGAVAVLPTLFLVIASAELVLRICTSLAVPVFDYKTHVFPTHLRLDGLFFGVVLSYYWNLQPRKLAFAQNARARLPLLLGSCALIVPALLLHQKSFFMRTLGLTCLSTGFSGILLWALSRTPSTHRLVRRVGTVLAAVGFYSYSIYLWHMPVLVVGVPVLARLMGRPLGSGGELVAYVVGTFAVGVVTAKAIELPSLRLRDRLFPA